MTEKERDKVTEKEKQVKERKKKREGETRTKNLLWSLSDCVLGAPAPGFCKILLCSSGKFLWFGLVWTGTL